MIPLFWPQMLKEEWLTNLHEMFTTSRWLGQGPKVDEFEKKFGEKFGYEYCVAVNSGTSALELAYELVDVNPGSIVMSPVLTCTATNIPLIRRGMLEFADICDDLTIDYKYVREHLRSFHRALVVVTLGGIPVDPLIFETAEDLGVPVIIDAAQSLGVPEIYGDYICYSFQAIKHFTTGDGGMLVCSDKEDYERAKRLRWFGIDREAKKRNNWQWTSNREMTQDIEEPGFKFHMNDIAATMGLAGLRHSDEFLAYRRALCEQYEGNLRDYVTCIWGGSCWLFAILVQNRDYVMQHLRHYGVECDTVQIRNDIFKVFGGKRKDLPNMNRLESQYLYLPLNSRVTLDDVNYISGRVIQAVTSPAVYGECLRCNEIHFIHQRCQTSLSPTERQ